MGLYRVTRRFEIDSAHRLYGYDGPCGRVHGHHYVVEVSLEGKKLDGQGMLIDFSEIKSGVVDLLLGEWDHRTLLWQNDPLHPCLPRNEVTLLPCQPTAENMAMLVWNWVGAWAERAGVRLANVRIYETPSCWVDYSDV